MIFTHIVKDISTYTPLQLFNEIEQCCGVHCVTSLSLPVKLQMRSRIMFTNMIDGQQQKAVQCL